MASQSHTKKTVYVALFANLAIGVVKGGAGVLSGSSALLAEAAHSVADTVNEIFLRVSLSLGERPPDERHPFGYGKERFFWAFLAAVFIFLSGGVFSLAEGVYRLLGHEEGGERFLIAYAALAFAFLAEGASLIRAIRQLRGEAADAGLSFARYVRTSTDPTTRTVLFEDSAAVIGVVFAFLGVALHELTSDPRYDAYAAMAIGVLLLAVGLLLGRNSKALLIGAAARPEEQRALRDAITAHDEVLEVLDLLTMHIGPRALLVAVRLDFARGVSADRIEELSNEIEEELKRVVPDVTTVFLDATPRGPARRRVVRHAAGPEPLSPDAGRR